MAATCMASSQIQQQHQQQHFRSQKREKIYNSLLNLFSVKVVWSAVNVTNKFTNSFYMCISEKCKKTFYRMWSFCAFVIHLCKSVKRWWNRPQVGVNVKCTKVDFYLKNIYKTNIIQLIHLWVDFVNICARLLLANRMRSFLANGVW